MKPIIKAAMVLLFCSQMANAENLQTINSLSVLDGKAFGSKTSRINFNHFAEYSISKELSVGSIAQSSRINSSHNNDTSYALNSVLQCKIPTNQNFLAYITKINTTL